MKGTTEHTEYTESRSAKESSVCSVYSVVERIQAACDVYTFCRFLNMSRLTCILCCSTRFNHFVDANEMVGELGEVLR